MPGTLVSYAQNFEDVVLWRALLHVEAGFYIDIGAQHPVLDSVSRGFYEQGWRGIHVEPATQYADLLRRDRPDEMVIQAAVAEEPGLLTFFEVADTGLSTAISEFADIASRMGTDVQKTTAPAVTLDQVLALSEGRDVHWLKIDVEGYEHAALKGWRESKVRPWTVLLESVAPHTREPVHYEWEPLLLEKGYEFVYFDGLNRYYVSTCHPELKAHFGYGPSVWDQFRLPDHSRLHRNPIRQSDPLVTDSRAAAAQRDELQTALDASQAGLAAEHEELIGKRVETESLRNEVLMAKQACAMFQQSFAKSEAKLSSTVADLDFAHQELNRTRLQAAEMREELEGRAKQLSAELIQVRDDLDTTRNDLAKLRADYQSLQDDGLRVSAELNALQSEYDTLQQRSDTWALELEEQRTEATVLRGKYEEIVRLAQRLSAENTSLRRTITHVHSAIDRAFSAANTAAENVSASLGAASKTSEDEPVDSIKTLLGYYDEAFVTKAYLSLLGRRPDPAGLNHFLTRLRAGENRLAILEDLHRSEEGRRVNASLPGLEEALSIRRRERTLTARLSRMLRGHRAGDEDIEAMVGHIRGQLAEFSDLHSAALKRVAALEASIREIATVFEKPVTTAATARVRIVRADRHGREPNPAEQEMERAFLHIAAQSDELVHDHALTAVIGAPDGPLNPDFHPAILIGHDWDESGYPLAWIDNLNSGYLAAGCTSQHARKILVDHGVAIPVAAVGAGVDDWDQVIPAELSDSKAKAFRFVHIAREIDVDGTDLAVASFARVFRKPDDVSLVIACTAKTESAIRAHIDSICGGDETAPDILLRVGNWTGAEIKTLFSQSSVLVAPARATGFSLPIAYAMLSGLGVIATRWGGHLDYCSEDNAWLVDFDFEDSGSNKAVLPSAWARVKESALDDALRSAYGCSPEARRLRSSAVRSHLSQSSSWKAVASRCMQLSREAEHARTLPRRRIGWVTTWNTKCGIAAAAGHLIETLPTDDAIIFAPHVVYDERLREDEENCRRIWHSGKAQNGLNQIIAELDRWAIGAVIIHFNYGFFNHAELSAFIECAIDRGVSVIVDLHSTDDPGENDPNVQLVGFLPALRRCHRILAHNPNDMNRLKALGLIDNVVLFPLGIVNKGYQHSVRNLAHKTPLLASFGFCFPNKGLSELVEAVSILKEQGQIVRLRMLNAQHPKATSKEEVDRLRFMITQLGLSDQIEFRTEYLDDDVCLDLLHEADLIVNPYQWTGESASAAARFSLASGRPVAVTPIPIFNDLGGAVFRMPGIRPSDIAAGITECLSHMKNDSAEYQAVRDVARVWLRAHDFGRQAIRLKNMLRTFEYDQALAANSTRT